MTSGTKNVVLLGVLLALLALEAALRPDPSRPNLEIMPEMVRFVSSPAFSRNTVFEDGKTLQKPVEGTIARDHLPLPFEPTRLGALLAGQQLANPYGADDAAALRRGAVVYGRVCATCHGPGGAGDGPVVARGYPAPPTFHTPLSRRMRDGQMFHIITYGRDNMAAFGSRIPSEDRWKAILHVRALQARAEAAEPDTAAEGAAMVRPRLEEQQP